MMLAAGVVVPLAAVIALGSCGQLECGAGTIEQDGECVASAIQPNRECGPGTTFDAESGRCVSDIIENGGGICGPNTTIQVNDAGVPVCVGTGGGGSCTDPLPCPAPTVANAVSFCGRIFDLESSQPLDDGVQANGEPYKTVEVRAIDPFAFVSNPSPEILARGTPDSCGRYVLSNIPKPGTPFLALATEDLTEGGNPVFGDNLVITGIAETVSAGEVIAGQRAWILRRTTDQAWSNAAGFGTGQTFGQRGVYLPIFISGDDAVAPFAQTPTRDVKVALIDMGTGMRAVRPANDFYFDDAVSTDRKMLNPSSREMTGVNGSALYINQSGITEFSGLGGLPGGVCWARNPAAAPPFGGVFVQERTASGTFCP